MNTRLVAIIAVIGLSVSAIGVGAAAIVVPPVEEQLVEGHTVFTVIETVRNTTSVREEFAAAVAVLVRELNYTRSASRFPGVLWFNDQFLVNPEGSSSVGSPQFRYPCTGAVLAVNRGAGDPRAMDISDATYVESYRVTDPNDREWIVDKFAPNGTAVWTVAIKGSSGATGTDATRNTTDNGGNCGAITDSYGTGTCLNEPFFPDQIDGCGVPSPIAQTPECSGCSSILYNALLYFRLEDLTQASTPKNHAVSSTDVSGCHGSYTNSWPCPGGNDDAEGNSHRYNPNVNFPWNRFDHVAEGNHGGSDSCDADPENETACHATRLIDIFYGRAPAPTTRQFALDDRTGSTAPYHCHPGVACSSSEYFDERLPP